MRDARLKAQAERLLLRARDELGATGMAALALLVLAALFLTFVLQPLEVRNAELAAQLERQSARAGTGRGGMQGAAAAANKLDTFYRYLGRGEAPTDWLAKLYGIASATGIEMESATYKTEPAGKRLERYEIVLPVTGTYLQLREFLKRALAEIPVLSLDQMSVKREARNEGAVQAELHLTLHLVKP